jgi:hypothetical protein
LSSAPPPPLSTGPEDDDDDDDVDDLSPSRKEWDELGARDKARAEANCAAAKKGQVAQTAAPPLSSVVDTVPESADLGGLADSLPSSLPVV